MTTRPPTEFENRVYEALKLIPEGRVTSYAELGRFLNCRSAQAVGQALKRNPFAPEIPCHRVVRSDGTIGGFMGKTAGREISKKEKLLQKEGVVFLQAGRVPPEQLYHFDE